MSGSFALKEKNPQKPTTTPNLSGGLGPDPEMLVMPNLAGTGGMGSKPAVPKNQAVATSGSQEGKKAYKEGKRKKKEEGRERKGKKKEKDKDKGNESKEDRKKVSQTHLTPL
jgi:hypothetical protein